MGADLQRSTSVAKTWLTACKAEDPTARCTLYAVDSDGAREGENEGRVDPCSALRRRLCFWRLYAEKGKERNAEPEGCPCDAEVENGVCLQTEERKVDQAASCFVSRSGDNGVGDVRGV